MPAWERETAQKPGAWCGVPGRGWGLPCEAGTADQQSSCPAPPGYQIAYRLASSSPNTFTTVEVGATVRQFTATELAPESAYVFRLSAKTRQGWGEPLEATVITTEKRGETQRPDSVSASGGERPGVPGQGVGGGEWLCELRVY